MAVTTPHPYKGEKTQVALAIENQQREEVTPTRYPGFLEGEQEMCDPEVEFLEGRYVGADRDPYDQVEGQRSYDGGSWSIVPYDGWPIAWAFGADSVAVDTPEVGLTQHTITRQQDGAPPTATVEAAYRGRGSQSDFVRTFLGVYPDTATIQQDNEGKLTIDASLIALGLSPETPHSNVTSVSLPEREPWKFSKVNSNLELQFGAGTQTFARLEDFQLEITNEVSPEYYINEATGSDPYEILYGNGGYTLDVEIAVTNTSIYQELVDANTPFNANIVFEKNNGNETLAITAKDCRMPTAPHNIPEDGKLTSPVSLSPRKTEIVVVDSQTTDNYLNPGVVA